MSDNKIKYGDKILLLDECHLYLDARLEENIAEGSDWLYRDISDLLDAVNGRSQQTAEPLTVYIAPAVYWLTEPGGEEPRFTLSGDKLPYEKKIVCPSLTLEGLGADAGDVVIAADRGQSQGCVGNYTMFHFTCEELRLRNLTVGNYCNVDLDYPLDRTQNRPKRSAAITQAQLGEVQGDRFYADNCRFVSRLNLMPMCGAARSLYRKCHFESTDDALNPHAVYLQCDFDFYGRRPLYQASPLGCAFLECVFRIYGREASHDADQYFMKNAGSVMVLGSVFEKCHAGEEAVSFRVEWAKYPPVSMKCYEYQNSFQGRQLVIGSSDTGTVSLEGREGLRAYYLEAEGEAHYNVWNLLHGEDGWDPLGMKGLVSAAGSAYEDMPVVLLPSETQMVLEDEEASALVRTDAYTFDGRKKPCNIFYRVENVPEAELFLSDNGDGSCWIRGRSCGSEAADIRVKAYTEEGLETEFCVTVKPKLKRPPVLAGSPVIICREGYLCMEYKLQEASDSGSTESRDASEITWYRRRGSDLTAVAVSHQGIPVKRYRLCDDDIGAGFQAELVPQTQGSLPGETLRVDYEGQVREADIQERGFYTTDFSSIPVMPGAACMASCRRGCWIADFYEPLQRDTLPEWHKREKPALSQAWRYGELGNGCVGKGLHPTAQGTKLFYCPAAEGDTMSLELVLDPAKTAGQGFGSAGQYLDVCLKFNLEELSGYALRVIRTPKAADGVSVYLVRYCQGKAVPISEEVITSCFLTDCHIEIVATKERMDAKVFTSTPIPRENPRDFPLEKPWAKQVKISSVIQPCRHTAFGLFHTGTMGNGGWENSLLLHKLSVRIR